GVTVALKGISRAPDTVSGCLTADNEERTAWAAVHGEDPSAPGDGVWTRHRGALAQKKSVDLRITDLARRRFRRSRRVGRLDGAGAFSVRRMPPLVVDKGLKGSRARHP
ncbi:MAG: hypothetical protein AAF368_16455, partial [Planctomycetota bacterium]